MSEVNIQKLYDHCIEQIEIATARRRIEKAACETNSWETGKILAYKDAARRLVDMGARVKNKESNHE